MVSITLKNIPEQLHARLKKRAKEHHRSLSLEILACLDQDQDKIQVASSEIINRAHAVRAKFKGQLTAREIDDSVNEG